MKLSVAGVIWRFYLMMAIILIAGFTHQWWLCLLALPVFFSALMGVELRKHFTVGRPKHAGKQEHASTEHLAHD